MRFKLLTSFLLLTILLGLTLNNVAAKTRLRGFFGSLSGSFNSSLTVNGVTTNTSGSGNATIALTTSQCGMGKYYNQISKQCLQCDAANCIMNKFYSMIPCSDLLAIKTNSFLSKLTTSVMAASGNLLSIKQPIGLVHKSIKLTFSVSMATSGVSGQLPVEISTGKATYHGLMQGDAKPIKTLEFNHEGNELDLGIGGAGWNVWNVCNVQVELRDCVVGQCPDSAIVDPDVEELEDSPEAWIVYE